MKRLMGNGVLGSLVLGVYSERVGVVSIELDDLSERSGSGGGGSKLSIAAALDMSNAQVSSAQAGAEEAQLLGELQDTDEVLGASVNVTDARLNGLESMTVGSTSGGVIAPGIAGSTYTLSVDNLPALGDSVRMALQRFGGEIRDVLYEVIDLCFVGSAADKQRAKSNLAKLFLGTENGELAAVMTGTLNQELPQKRPQ